MLERFRKRQATGDDVLDTAANFLIHGDPPPKQVSGAKRRYTIIQEGPMVDFVDAGPIKQPQETTMDIQKEYFLSTPKS